MQHCRFDVDFNVVMTGEGKFVETQGTAEHGTYDRAQMNELLVLAEKGINDSFALQREVLAAAGLPAL